MKKADLLFIVIALAILFPFIPFPFLKSGLQDPFLYNEKFWVLTSFIKFAILATLGEVLGLRMKTGQYLQAGFGIIPRALVWGLLGISIKVAFAVFSSGVPAFLAKSCSVPDALDAMGKKDIFDAWAGGLGYVRLLAAFSISVLMNLFFAPVMMTVHKITDTHIMENGGTLGGFFTPIKIGKIFAGINWKVQWDFVFKRTIPFFWIPAHTITFLLPGQYRVAFAAILGTALGVILAIASQKGKKA
jgi:hypothetical protein